MELNCILFPSLKAKISMDVFLSGKMAYIPKLKRLRGDEVIPLSPRSSCSGPSEMMAKYPPLSFKATKNIYFDQQPQEARLEPVKEGKTTSKQMSSYFTQISTDEVTQFFSEQSSFDDQSSKQSICEQSLSQFQMRESTTSIKSAFYERPLEITENIKKQNTNTHRMSVPNIAPSIAGKIADPQFMGYDITEYAPCGYVPVIYLESNTKSDNLLIYFHGNGEDTFSSFPLLNHLRNILEINVMAVEYPGYGHYKSQFRCTSEMITEDADYVMQFVLTNLKFELKNIIIVGRSLGTGPATEIASKHAVGALVLISAFTSIRGVFQEFAGFLKYIVKERFNNLENIKKVISPTFFLHGKSDTHISYKQSVSLSQTCKCVFELNTPPEMNHREFDYTDNLALPLLNFLHRNDYPLGKRNPNRIPFPEGLTYHPSQLSKISKQP